MKNMFIAIGIQTWITVAVIVASLGHPFIAWLILQPFPFAIAKLEWEQKNE